MKKARLDLLEEMPAIEAEAPKIEPIIEEEIPIEEPVEPGKVWAFNKLLLIGAPVVVVVFIIVGVLVYFLVTKEPARKVVVEETVPPVVHKPVIEPHAPVLPPKPIVVAEATRTIYVKDFMIDLKDNQGNNRVLLCDVAFDIAKNSETEKIENNPEVRNIIYATAKRRSAVALKSLEERKKMKKDLAVQIDRVAGKAIVRNVYFINYFIM